MFSALALVVLALLGVGGYAIASSVGAGKVSAGAKTGPAVVRRSAKPSPTPSRIGTASTPVPADASRHAATHPRRRPAHAARAHGAAHAAPRVGLLAPLDALAYGPDGVVDGDNPQGAAFAIDGDQSLPWETDWYTTPGFGDLKQGTGLLLDMGRRVTITGAEVILGGIPGADLQLRAGDSPELSLLPPVASASGAGGATRFRLGPHVRARYVLLWFTRLPPDASGTYQASVYGVRLTGRP